MAKARIEMRTHGLDWRRKVRESTHFLALCTPAWQRDPLSQRQLTYARQLGKPIVFLVPQGATPPHTQDGERVYYYADMEDCAQLVSELAEGER